MNSNLFYSKYVWLKLTLIFIEIKYSIKTRNSIVIKVSANAAFSFDKDV